MGNPANVCSFITNVTALGLHNAIRARHVFNFRNSAISDHDDWGSGQNQAGISVGKLEDVQLWYPTGFLPGGKCVCTHEHVHMLSIRQPLATWGYWVLEMWLMWWRKRNFKFYPILLNFNSDLNKQPRQLWSTAFQQGCQSNSMGERTVFSMKGAGTTGFPHAKEWGWTPASQHLQKITQNGTKTSSK